MNCFLIPSVRPDLMAALIRSWDNNPLGGRWKAAVAFVQYSADDRAKIIGMLGDRLHRAIDLDTRTPPFLTRQAVLRACPEPDVWGFLDDDMEFTRETNYDAPLQAIESPGTGIVSCNWVRNESPALRARCRYEPTFIKQPLVNMSGGMIMSAAVADLTRQHDAKPYAFDDTQYGLLAYLAGYDNYRYLGSILIHRIMQKDGLKKTYREQAFVAPDPRWINIRACKPVYGFPGQNHYIPIPRDLTAAAHAAHHDARTARGW